MRVLAIHRNYWDGYGIPASTGKVIAEELVRAGHDVTVFTSMPKDEPGGGLIADQTRAHRRDNVNGVAIRRVWVPKRRRRNFAARGLDLSVFVLRVIGHLIGRALRYDVVVVSTNPPILLAASVRVLTRLLNVDYIYRLQDLNPEAALISGVLSPGLRSRVLGHIEQRNRLQAATNVVLSSDMGATLESQGVLAEQVCVINNFMASGVEGVVLPAALRKPEGVFRVLFAGNLGLVQGLDTVVDAARILADRGSNVQFAFVGSGLAEASLRSRAHGLLGKSVVFLPRQPRSAARMLMEDADLGLVSLMPGIQRVAYPSKTVDYLEAGCPVVVIADLDSQLVADVTSSGAGYACRPNDAQGLADRLGELSIEKLPDPEDVRFAAVSLFGPELAIASWLQLVDGVGSDG